MARKTAVPPLRDYQTELVDFFLRRRIVACHDEMGLGKTRAWIHACAQMKDPVPRGCVVLCPSSLKFDVWEPQIAQWWPDRLRPPYIFVHQAAKNAAEKLRELLGWLYRDARSETCFAWIVCNYEAIRTVEVKRGEPEPSQNLLFNLLVAAVERMPFAVVADEAHRLKNHRAIQTINATKIAQDCKYKATLTGTPLDNPLDLYAQGRFLSPSLLGSQNFYTFRARYAQMGGYNNKQAIAWKNLDDLQHRLSKYAIRRTKAEVLSQLPQKLEPVTRTIEMTKEQDEAYLLMLEQGLTLVQGEEPMQATNALTQTLRLMQITSGQLAGRDAVKGKNPKLQLLGDVIDDAAERKIVIWCREHWEINLLHAFLLAEFNIDASVYHGALSESQRSAMLQRFQDTDKTSVFIGQINTGGLGLTLTAASVAVYFSNDWSHQVRIQSEDRMHRLGQKNVCSYIDLAAVRHGTRRQTIDHHVLKVLAKKASWATYVIDNYRRIMKGDEA